MSKSFIPIFKASPARDLEFQINALGEFKEDQSNINGSFKSKILHLPSLSIKSNKGSFHFQSQKNIGILKLTEFLYPLIDEEYPIQINLKKKSLAGPRLFLSTQILKIKAINLSNLIIENLFLSFDSMLPRYSRFVKDLDLADLYFKEISNLSGSFSGHRDQIKFLVNSNSAILQNRNQNFISASILGEGNLSASVFDLKARIKNQSASIDLALNINLEPINSLFIELTGQDVSKDLATEALIASENLFLIGFKDEDFDND